MAAHEATVLKWVHDDYVRDVMERQRRAIEEIAARLHGREEGDVIILGNSDEEASEPSNPVCHGNPGIPGVFDTAIPGAVAREAQLTSGCSKDDGGVQDDDDDGNDYTNFYKLLDM
ncbi:hypothetical protein D1007_32266 [Hordeum vulgare]|nr:hypothetical protein D1007_32266 [Hordeum vulgare]